MVCHVDYCLKIGQTKIREVLLKWSLGVPIVMASVSMFYLDNLRDSIMCTGREEMLRFNTENFLKDVTHSGVVILLPLLHPYRIFALILGMLCI